MNTYIYTGSSSLLTMKDNDIKNFDTISNHYLNIDWAWVIEEDRNMKGCDCCEACVKEA